jgi:NAD(P)-dependent dehydrogenase (short-subunit alcohol dehydrogenase family)
MTMGVNHLGHFYLTSLLWEKIKISNHPRIINVSSLLAHKQPKGEKDTFIIDLDDMNYDKDFDHNLAYSRSKLANILFARQLQANMDKSGIKGLSLSLHPGVIVTELAREFGIKLTIMKIVFCLFIALCTKSPIQGAQTTLYLVL